MQRPPGYREFALTKKPTLGDPAGRRKVTRQLMDEALELLTVWLDSFVKREVETTTWQTEEALLGEASKLYWIGPRRWVPKWEQDPDRDNRSYYSSGGWITIDVDPYGDEGGAGTLHILAEIGEQPQYDYSVLRDNRCRKPPFLGYQVSWHIRMLMWDFDTIVDPFWNSTTADGAHERDVYPLDKDGEVIPRGEDEDVAVEWEVYEAAPAESAWLPQDGEHAKYLPMDGMRPQGVAPYYFKNNPRRTTTKPQEVVGGTANLSS